MCITHQAYVKKHELPHWTTNSDTHLYSYHHCLSIKTCNHYMQSCIFSEWKAHQCQTKLNGFLKIFFKKMLLRPITCKQQLTTDHQSTPQTIIKSNENFLDAWIEMLRVLYYYIPLCLHSKENFLLNWSKPSNQVNVLCYMFLSRMIPVILKMKLKDTNGTILKQKFTILPFIIKTSFMLHLLINIYLRLSKTCNTD